MASWTVCKLYNNEIFSPIKNKKLLIIIKVTSYYGLLDVQSILAPIATGQQVQLPYYPGHHYAAYRASEFKEVIS